MKKIKNIFIIFVFTITLSCGYTPLINNKNANINISELIFEGDRQLNNYILSNLKKYQQNQNKGKNYKLKILSTYSKSITNKDDNGDPKNYNLEIKLLVNIISETETINGKIFKQDISLAAKNKKIEEKELEKKHRKKISKILSNEIIFYLMTR
tara:strand:- start:9313 stop:9774 length:462 start_codon:yes stop_codon:yes gene_type:complete